MHKYINLIKKMNANVNKNEYKNIHEKYKKYLVHMFRPSTCIKLIPNF